MSDNVDTYLEEAQLSNAEYEEAKRVERWHATYNAALQGLYAHRSESKDPRHHEIDIDARIAADIAHGALEKKA